MRKTSLFISSVVMLLAGFYLVVDEIFWQTKILGVALVGGVALIVLGAYLQWVASKLKNDRLPHDFLGQISFFNFSVAHAISAVC